MDSRNLRKTKALCVRYLDPNRSWTGTHDRALRTLVREHSDCAAWYDRAVTIHRELVGANPMLPSAFERNRMAAAAVDSAVAGAAVTSGTPTWLRWAVPLAVAGAAVVVISNGTFGPDAPSVIPLPSPVTPEYIGARGGGSEDTSDVAVGLSGVTVQSETQYEVAAAGSYLYLDDYLRISTTRSREDLGYLFAFGVQDGRDPIWYEPDPTEGGLRSVATPLDEVVPLGGKDDPIEFKVSGRHVAGSLTVYAIFSSVPLAQPDVAAALEMKPSDVATDAWILARFSTAETPIAVAQATTRIRPGGKEAEP